MSRLGNLGAWTRGTCGGSAAPRAPLHSWASSTALTTSGASWRFKGAAQRVHRPGPRCPLARWLGTAGTPWVTRGSRGQVDLVLRGRLQAAMRAVDVAAIAWLLVEACLVMVASIHPRGSWAADDDDYAASLSAFAAASTPVRAMAGARAELACGGDLNQPADELGLGADDRAIASMGVKRAQQNRRPGRGRHRGEYTRAFGAVGAARAVPCSAV